MEGQISILDTARASVKIPWEIVRSNEKALQDIGAVPGEWLAYLERHFEASYDNQGVILRVQEDRAS